MFFHKVIVLIVCIVCASCKKGDQYPATRLIAHAGAGLHNMSSPYHDNSSEAINYASQIELIDGIELDVQSDKNGELWLFHDDFLEFETAKSGCLSEYDSEEIKSIRYSGLKHEHLVSFSDALNQLSSTKKQILLDVRNRNSCTGSNFSLSAILSQLKIELEAYPALNCAVILNTSAWVKAFYGEGFEVYLQLEKGSDWKKHAEILDQLTGFCVNNTTVNNEDVDEVHAVNKQMIIFDVRSPKGTRSALRKKPDMVMVDDIKVALSEKYK